MKRYILVLGAAALLLSTVGACGGDDAAEPDASGEIRIELNEFSFSPSTIRVNAGDTVTFVLDNIGEKEHEFMIGKRVNTDDGFPNGFHVNFFDGLQPTVVPMDAAMGMEDMDMGDEMGDDMAMDEGDDHDDEMGHEDHGFMIMREPTESATVTITIPDDAVGEWEIACFEEDGAHYDDGMKGTLIVDA